MHQLKKKPFMVGREEIVRSIIKFEIPHSDLKGACWRIIELGA